jgi:hypothetical protein
LIPLCFISTGVNDAAVTSTQNASLQIGKSTREQSHYDWDDISRALTLPFRVPGAAMKVPFRRALGKPFISKYVTRPAAAFVAASFPIM